jgi:hypothetical protein
MAMVIAGLLISGVLGFALGLFAFRVKSRWCPDCGAWTYRHRPAQPWVSRW